MSVNVEQTNWNHLKPLFGAVSAKDKVDILKHFDHVPFETDQMILTAGCQSDQMFIVTSGRLHIFMDGPNGRIELKQIGPGNFFGEVSVFDPGHVSANVCSLSEGELLAIRNVELFKLFLEKPKLVAPLMKNIAVHLTQSIRRTSSANFKLQNGIWQPQPGQQRHVGLIDWIRNLVFGHEGDSHDN
jgi:CRP/FNR family transcriptional regulator, anaerobic regulatory protein